MVYGVASWQGQGVDFTDGHCHACSGLASSELGFDPAPLNASPRRATAIVAALFFLLAPEVLDQFPTSVLPWPAAVRPATLVPVALGVGVADADEPPAPVPDVASVLAMVTAAASAMDGPVVAPPPPPSTYVPDRTEPSLRWDLHRHDPATTLVAHNSVQAP